MNLRCHICIPFFLFFVRVLSPNDFLIPLQWEMFLRIHRLYSECLQMSNRTYRPTLLYFQAQISNLSRNVINFLCNSHLVFLFSVNSEVKIHVLEFDRCISWQTKNCFWILFSIYYIFHLKILIYRLNCKYLIFHFFGVFFMYQSFYLSVVPMFIKFDSINSILKVYVFYANEKICLIS